MNWILEPVNIEIQEASGASALNL